MPISLSQVLSVILALAVVYYVLGLMVAFITKRILEIFETKGKSLEGFLKRNLLGTTEKGHSELLEKLKKTPELNSLKPVRYALGGLGFFIGKTKISDVIENVPPKSLVDALFDLDGTVATGAAKVQQVIDRLPDQLIAPNGTPIPFAVKTQLQALADNNFANVEELRFKMETWFTGLMDQASQEFKAQARRVVVFISLIVTVFFGVDSISLAKLYWNNATLSATADAQASLILASSNAENQQNARWDELAKQLDAMKANDKFWFQKPANAPDDWSWWQVFLSKFLGMLITILAVSQGSSFWYDIIKQIKGEQTTTTTTTTSTVQSSPSSSTGQSSPSSSTDPSPQSLDEVNLVQRQIQTRRNR